MRAERSAKSKDQLLQPHSKRWHLETIQQSHRCHLKLYNSVLDYRTKKVFDGLNYNSPLINIKKINSMFTQLTK